jgi:hypothetical protein
VNPVNPVLVWPDSYHLVDERYINERSNSHITESFGFSHIPKQNATVSVSSFLE